MTSYQRLKKKNHELRNHIYKLMNDKDFLVKELMANEIHKDALERAWFGGLHSGEIKGFNGIFNGITNDPRRS